MAAIDWSKAPEGATHFYLRGDTPWRDLSGENWKWYSDGKWHSDNAVHASIDRSSRGFFERRCAELIPRPIRTPEQIAAEAISKQVDAMLSLDTYPKGDAAGGLMSRRAFCEALIEDGYRKFEITYDSDLA